MYSLRYLLIICIIIFCANDQIQAQKTELDSLNVTRGVIEGSDTIPLIELPELRVYDQQDFEYLYLKRRYRRLIHNVKKAYPYSKIAGIKLKELDEHLTTIKDEKEQKVYIELAEEEIMDEFEKEVKHLTVTQGIILVKLIDRETGRTSYQVIRELKGRFTAFLWQGIARIFGNNLKAEYDPDDKDRIIEDIVQGIEAGFI